MKEYLIMADDRPERQELVWRIALRYRELNEAVTIMVVPPVQFNDLPSLHSPHWIKAWAWDLVPPNIDHITWLDSDCVPLVKMPEWPDVPFAAVPDLTIGREAEKSHAIRSLSAYFNAGVWSATRAAVPAFDRLKAMDPVGRWWEQGAFNLAVHETLGGFTELPESCNWMDYSRRGLPDDTRIIHLAGYWKNKDLEIERLLEATEP